MDSQRARHPKGERALTLAEAVFELPAMSLRLVEGVPTSPEVEEVRTKVLEDIRRLAEAQVEPALRE
jgi:hypothetical protein